MDKLVVKRDEQFLIGLTESQQKAFKDIQLWFNSKGGSSSYVLSGEAGTGKSFLTDKLIRYIFKKARKRVCVSAPTHKAVRVIESFTKLQGLTLHSLLGLRPSFNVDNFDASNLKFETIGKLKIAAFDLVIMDESSMVSKGLYKLLDFRAVQFNCKMLFIGDKYQLLPVKEDRISTIFDIPSSSILTDIVRQQLDSPLVNILSTLRHDVEDNSSNFIRRIYNEPHNIKDGDGYSATNKKGFIKVIDNYFKRNDYADNTNYVKIGSFTNARIQKWNRYVRSLTIKSTDLIVKGDILMGYKTVVDQFLSPIVINSNDYLVEQVDSRISDDGFRMYVLTLKDLTDDNIVFIYIVDHLDKTFKNYINILHRLHSNARFGELLVRGSLWKMFYDYKDRYLTMRDIPIVYNDGYTSVIKKELDYGYAVTITKLQGSTINNILIDMLDICYYPPTFETLRYNTKNVPNAIDNRNRHLYTGISRASEKAILLSRH